MDKTNVYKQNFNLQYFILFEKIIPLFESTCLLGYCSGNEKKLVIKNPLQQEFLEKVKRYIRQNLYVNQYVLLEDMVEYHYKECEAMLVAIKQRKKLKKQIEEYKLLVKDYLTYLEEVESGKNPLKKVVHDKDLSKKLIQNQIEQCTRDEGYTKDLIEYVNQLIIKVEMKKFEKNYTEVYKKSMMGLAQMDSMQFNSLNDLWKSVQNQS